MFLMGVQFIYLLQNHFPDVLSCSAVGLESKSCPLHGTFPVCENSKTKNPVTGAAKQMASFPLHFVWWQMYGFGSCIISAFSLKKMCVEGTPLFSCMAKMHPWMNVTYNIMQHESLRLKPTVRGSNMPKMHGGTQWAAASLRDGWQI
ncbi:hypothetical protein NC652_037257 [Populus alba x Populus x berolinensis]|nr:hypothetical protein NC652_037257 [Populus alba x Populus x berolinensis]